MRKKGSFLMTLGVLFLVAALLLTGYNMYESTQAEKASKTAVEGILTEVERLYQKDDYTTADYELFPEKEMPTIEVDAERYIGILEVPDLNLVLPVMSGEWSYAKLKKAPCRYEGSVYQDDLVIAGHNYRSHFSKIKSLDVGSEIKFIDADGNVFVYEMGWVEVLKADDVEEMIDASDWDMTLFTCTYGGEERYTIRCIKVE